MRIRVIAATSLAVLTLTLTACSSDDGSDSKPTPKASTDNSSAEKAAGIPPKPTGEKRTEVLAAIRDVNAKLTADEDKAIDAARNQCSALNGGATNPDHIAALRFSYDGLTLTDDDGAHLNHGLRKTLCPET